MTISISDACAQILAGPLAPVVQIDTCNFIDLFRTEISESKVPYKPRVPHQEIREAVELLSLVSGVPAAAHLFIPELVAHEYSHHADVYQGHFGKWTELHDTNQGWLQEASLCIALALPDHHPVHPHDLAAHLRRLANNLLGKAQVLERDQPCVDRALNRLINKRRPSHKKEIKDSINLEQCLELSRRLQYGGFTKSRVWVSSNTNDFAQPGGSRIHVELQSEFAATGLKYFTSIRAALGSLRASGEI